MGINLNTIKRGSKLLEENKEISKTITKVKSNKKIGRKKIDEEEKASEKVMTYVTKKEKQKLEDKCKDKGIKLSQYFRILILADIK